MRARKLGILTLIIVALLSGACAPVEKYRATAPELRATLLLANLSPQSDLDKLTPQQVRAKGNRLLMLLKGKPVAVASVSEQSIAGPRGPIKLRIYRPQNSDGLPVLVFFHGGAFIQGNLDTHDNICRYLAARTPSVVVSVDYRLAPENPYPAATEDCFAALEWAAAGLGQHGVFVSGDSAGGNLAAGVSLMARDRARPQVDGQILFYPVIDLDERNLTASRQAYSNGYLLDERFMRLAARLYKADPRDPYASPAAAADLAGLPAALVITAEFDPLRDEGETYAARLKLAGVATTLHRYQGLTHCFVSMDRSLPQALTALDEAGAFVRQHSRLGVQPR